jgi:O-antigen/teichoic acid export membrane protein
MNKIKPKFGSTNRINWIYAFLDKGIAGLFGVILVILIIRRLPKEEFGAFMLSESFRVIFVSSLDVAIGQAMIKYIAEQDDNDSIIFFNSLIFKTLLWLGSTIALITFSFFASGWFNSVGLGKLLFVLPILMLSMFLNNLPKQYLMAKLKIGHLFALDLSLFALFILGFFIFSANLNKARNVILLLSAVYALNSVQGWMYVYGKINLISQVSSEWITKLYRFSKHSLLNNISVNVYNQSNPVIIGILMDASSVAVFGAAMVFTQVFYMMGEAFNMIVFPLTSKEISSRTEPINIMAARVYHRYLPYLLLLSFPLGFILVSIPELILDIVYGGKYTETGAATILRFIGVWGLVAPFIRILGSVVNGIGRPEILAKTISISAATNILFNFVLIPFLGLNGSAAALLISMAVMFLAIHTFTRKVLNVNYIIPIRDAFKICCTLLPRRSL